jgi:hypothetical protein
VLKDSANANAVIDCAVSAESRGGWRPVNARAITEIALSEEHDVEGHILEPLLTALSKEKPTTDWSIAILLTDSPMRWWNLSSA